MAVTNLKFSSIQSIESRRNSFRPRNIPNTAGGNETKQIGQSRYHIFASSGNFELFQDATIEVLAAGGGGGGSGINAEGGGGGGAGELDLFTSLNLTAGTYTVLIGAAGLSAIQTGSSSGGTSSFGSTLVSALGGGRGAYDGSFPAGNGGSGGGGATNSTNGGTASGSNTNVGGNRGSDANGSSGGGGGGATGAGSNGSARTGGNGGAGYTLSTIDANLTSANFTSFSGMTVICSGGGGAGRSSTSTAAIGTGGTGAGNGGALGEVGGVDVQATSATSYGSGGGGGTTTNRPGGHGMPGLVIVRVKAQ